MSDDSSDSCDSSDSSDSSDQKTFYTKKKLFLQKTKQKKGKM